MTMTELGAIFAFILGAVVGSFLNVCIWRIPEGLSIVKPASHCPDCGHPIRFYDNIPLISYLILRGRCRACGGRISLRYPFVEGLTALMALFLFWKFGLTLKFLAAFIFVSALILITFIDIDYQIIPDVISLPGIPICFLMAVFIMDLSFMDALLGLLIGGGSLYLVAVLYELATKREGMGGGDIKLLALMGAFLGWKSLLFILLVSSLVGAVVGISIMLARGGDMKYAVPFGPFLSLAAVAYLFVGEYATNLFLYHQL
ncbi:prepilin peptidase [Syntrophus aciditrophicus]|uniref:Prepilin leader peptidase/N-methyltransferase n=1 Tax=Syntrophus aciditrophicus (strain SB) TaxID=56780 RepID=Q2LVV6_SYNAS|nr:A24 family peptidase [Syntrophus aciditrophicus]ABC78219.1 type 4 prepilin-like proteins leader peptide processing enzyme [Syntrophus aciditrophicus SB]OPY18482.1 MAG: Leader peptidase PppA [Syntrophus sp. PtaB.Bin075]